MRLWHVLAVFAFCACVCTAIGCLQWNAKGEGAKTGPDGTSSVSGSTSGEVVITPLNPFNTEGDNQ